MRHKHMHLASITAATGLLSLAIPATAGMDDAVHKKCLEARDYAGYVETLNSAKSSLKSNTPNQNEAK